MGKKTTKQVPGKARPPLGPIVRSWLVFYNAASAVGWAYVLFLFFRHLLHTLPSHTWYEGVYGAVKDPLKAFLPLSLILEVLHAATGLVPSGVVPTALQMSARVFMVWGVAHLVPKIQTTVYISLFVVPWCVAEVTRYPYYVTAVLGIKSEVLLWCRYTLFIVLYPLGMFGEALTMYAALGPIKEGALHLAGIPSNLQGAFQYYYYFVLVLLLAWMPCWWPIYMHMFRQRKKALGKPSTKEE
ncbi:very-long-chain (3R)-3-hydroxyacyl-CoA dehydratase 1-like [Branchiostoma lanceolatum]|uniref:very-long-chain (3R)-3-hydroxyacyl-CoA dehydratase 1-like n=1 Tax=Branchiostoma lanceolatum TaxID=7740 RepID=UPI003454AE64